MFGGARICVYRNVRRSGGPSVPSGCPRIPPGAESPETGSGSSGGPGRWASGAPPVTGDRRGPGPPTRTGLRTWTEQEFPMTQNRFWKPKRWPTHHSAARCSSSHLEERQTVTGTAHGSVGTHLKNGCTDPNLRTEPRGRGGGELRPGSWLETTAAPAEPGPGPEDPRAASRFKGDPRSSFSRSDQ